MKRRIGFVTNSSTSNFIICNLSQEKKTVADFIRENPRLVSMFNSYLSKDKSKGELDEFNSFMNQGELVVLPITADSLVSRNEDLAKKVIEPRRALAIVEREEHEDLIRWFFTEMSKWLLKEGGESENFIYDVQE
jgi:hypothetical protein